MDGRSGRIWRLAVFGSLLGFVSVAPAGTEANEAAALRAKYQAHLMQLRAHPRFPITIEGGEGSGWLRGDVYAVLDFPYVRVAESLRQGSRWCEIAPLHLNVKACTHQARPDGTLRLTFYGGRKFYQPPELTQPFIYRYRVEARGPGYFRATLTPDEETRDSGSNRIVVEAMPVGRDRVFLRFQYLFRYRPWMRFAAGMYFSTLGSGKIGFTVIGTDPQGRPIHVTGIPGATERNAMRYFLALHAYFSTLDVPEAKRFERRLERWFDLTEQYAAQLRELSRPDYLTYKRKEREQQLRLQRELDAAGR